MFILAMAKALNSEVSVYTSNPMSLQLGFQAALNAAFQTVFSTLGCFNVRMSDIPHRLTMSTTAPACSSHLFIRNSQSVKELKRLISEHG